MVVVIFRSRLDPNYSAEYQNLAARMEERARRVPGFLSMKTFAAEDGEHVSIIEFASEESLRAWSQDPEHAAAQLRGREALYTEYKIQVCKPIRNWEFRREKTAMA